MKTTISRDDSNGDIVIEQQPADGLMPQEVRFPAVYANLVTSWIQSVKSESGQVSMSFEFQRPGDDAMRRTHVIRRLSPSPTG